jgi:flagellar M-ring protein FliF
VVILLLFGVLRPAMRQIIQPKALKKPADDAVDVTLVDDDEDGPRLVAALQQDEAPPLRALASDAYEDRLRQAREAVKADSKQVAQVVKDWVASDE